MAERGTNNAKFIIPAVLALWLVSTLLTNKSVPGWLKGISGVAMGVAIVGLIVFLFLRQSGWRELARRYPAVPALAADRWRTCRTAVLSRVALDQGSYERSKVRLSFIVRVGSDDQALYLSAICRSGCCCRRSASPGRPSRGCAISIPRGGSGPSAIAGRCSNSRTIRATRGTSWRSRSRSRTCSFSSRSRC